MLFEIPKEDILKGLIRQLNALFSVSDTEMNVISSLEKTVFQRCEYNFLKTKINITHEMMRPILILIIRDNIQSFFIIFQIQFLRKQRTIYN